VKTRNKLIIAALPLFAFGISARAGTSPNTGSLGSAADGTDSANPTNTADRAVTAAMSAGAATHDHIQALVDAIAPVVAEAKKDPKDPLDAAVRLNVRKVVGELAGSEPILAHEAKEGHIRIVGAYYSLDTGAVTLVGGP